MGTSLSYNNLNLNQFRGQGRPLSPRGASRARIFEGKAGPKGPRFRGQGREFRGQCREIRGQGRASGPQISRARPGPEAPDFAGKAGNFACTAGPARLLVIGFRL